MSKTARILLVEIGSSTAKALMTRGIVPDLVPGDAVSDALVAVFPRPRHRGPPAGRPTEEGRALFVRAERVRDVVAPGLAAKGWRVDEVVAYRTVAGGRGPGRRGRRHGPPTPWPSPRRRRSSARWTCWGSTGVPPVIASRSVRSRPARCGRPVCRSRPRRPCTRSTGWWPRWPPPSGRRGAEPRPASGAGRSATRRCRRLGSRARSRHPARPPGAAPAPSAADARPPSPGGRDRAGGRRPRGPALRGRRPGVAPAGGLVARGVAALGRLARRGGQATGRPRGAGRDPLPAAGAARTRTPAARPPCRPTASPDGPSRPPARRWVTISW